MWNRGELKRKGKAAFKGNYWASVAVSLFMGITASAVAWINGNPVEQIQSAQNSWQSMLESYGITGEISYTPSIGTDSPVSFFIVMLINIFITNMILVGGYRFFIATCRNEHPGADHVFSAYKNGHFLNIFITMFLRDLFNALWFMLLIIPGIVKYYSYRMVPFILAEDPGMSPTEAITRSRMMMKGNKWKTFVLDLSFIGWILVEIITLGIAGIFYVAPYMQATDSELYLTLKGEN